MWDSFDLGITSSNHTMREMAPYTGYRYPIRLFINEIFKGRVCFDIYVRYVFCIEHGPPCKHASSLHASLLHDPYIIIAPSGVPEDVFLHDLTEHADYRGLEYDLAGEICDLAAGGQILIGPKTYQRCGRIGSGIQIWGLDLGLGSTFIISRLISEPPIDEKRTALGGDLNLPST